MCDCINTITKNTTEYIQKRSTERKQDMLPIDTCLDEGLQNTTYLYPMDGNTLQTNELLKTEFTFRVINLKKDGTFSKPRKESISIIFTYCPFCGKEYNPKPAAEIPDITDKEPEPYNMDALEFHPTNREAAI